MVVQFLYWVAVKLWEIRFNYLCFCNREVICKFLLFIDEGLCILECAKLFLLSS